MSPVNVRISGVNKDSVSDWAREGHFTPWFGLFFESIHVSKILLPSIWQWSLPNPVGLVNVREN